jgi:hypothetical protein
MITLLILGGAAVAALVAGASLRRKKSGVNAERVTRTEQDANADREADDAREANVGRTLQSDCMAFRKENCRTGESDLRQSDLRQSDLRQFDLRQSVGMHPADARNRHRFGPRSDAATCYLFV